MKTIEVVTTESDNRRKEILYAYNGACGIELTNNKYVARFFPEAIKLRVIVDYIFPGTDEEWDDHIKRCVEDTLRHNGLLRKVGMFEFI